jgi:hypothetical protein
MKFEIEIKENERQISKKILKALIPEVDKFMKKAVSEVKKDLPIILRNAIMSSETYYALVGGKLRFELGIPDSISKLDALISIWTNDVNVTYVKPTLIGSDKIFAFFSVGLVQSDYSDVLGTNYAQVYDKKGYYLPWLQWLLFEGTKPLISTHKVVFTRGGRTGGAIMRKPGSWSIPIAYAGTATDNWITRAIDNSSPQIEDLLKRIFK